MEILPLSATATVFISVYNDPHPAFLQKNYSYYIPENQRPGSTVGYVRAHVRDLPPHHKLQYQLDSDYTDDTFAINSNTGEITTNKILDREAVDYYHLLVIAVYEAEGKIQNISATVAVDVVDENDNAPVLDFPTEINNHISIKSSVPVGHKVFQIIAHDDDEDENAELVYSFADHYYLFEVDSGTGAVYTRTDFTTHKDSVLLLIVMVADKGEFSRATWGAVNITII